MKSAEQVIADMQMRLVKEMNRRRETDAQNRQLQSKIAKQRKEIERQQHKIHALEEQRSKMLADLRWHRGESAA